MVRDDTADEVGLGVVQGCHELGQGLLVELAHCPEHSLLGLGGTGHGAVRHLGEGIQANNAVTCVKDQVRVKLHEHVTNIQTIVNHHLTHMVNLSAFICAYTVCIQINNNN